ncbi:hypothetical protein NQ315_002102 [Exocentrus adspersus]|uniref:Uncharacterized protein n=1 Tax=Exocentrus adspersus TaxID=1586481 RepID=A0AAV8W0T0_9CUCU|nr:hypothetical protein NQ315_002102 [Exocentrus adspersus]
MEKSNTKADITKETGILNFNLHGGRAIATVKHGEEIVISGISGCFPNSNNVHEFRDNLFNKVNMVLPNRRWVLNHPEIPDCSGTIPNIEQYDTGFFGVHERQSHSMDPMLTMLQEKTIEAIFDAGLHPTDLENTKTGVYVGICYSENDKTWFFDNLATKTYALTGAERSMVAHRLSYFLKLKGPSYTADTACSSSLYALEQAYRALRMGEIDTAIVGGTNLVLHPFVSLQLGVLSKDGSCKAFDEQGNGYARSEAVGVLVLQRSKHAKRIYSQIVHVKTNCDGYKEQGITFPSKDAQKELLIEFYDECQMDRYSLSFLETHGTGTFVGDPEECSAIDDVFATRRTKPLMIGSVKSNVGHSEPASGVCSIIKALFLLLPVLTLKDQYLDIVYKEVFVLLFKGVNSFGFGGGNCHVLLRQNPKTKVNNGLPKDNLPRLVCLSARTEEGVTSLFDSVAEKFDAEYIKLLHDGFRKNVENHLYRGYVIVSRLGNITRSIKFLRKYFPGTPPPLYVAFGELDNWYNIGCELMALPTFSAFIQKIQKICVKQEVDILDIFCNKSNNNIGEVLGSVVVHLGLIELFRSMEVKPAYLLGYSHGALLSAYCDGSLSLEETITCAATINEATNNLWLEANNNNDQETTTVKDGKITNVRAANSNHILNGGNRIDFSNSEMLNNKKYTHLKDLLLQNLLENLTSRKSEKDTTRVNNIINSIFNRVSNTEPVAANSVLLQIGYSPREETEDVTSISLFSCKSKSYLLDFLKGLGRVNLSNFSLYEIGYNPQINKLYPDINLPVSRGTRMISPYIKWKHSRSKTIPMFNLEVAAHANISDRTFAIQVDNTEWNFIKGHMVDGRILFPATGYLYLVWETFSIMNNLPISVMKVCFQNCKFIRATPVTKRNYFFLNIGIQSASGDFEVTEGDSVVVTGRITFLTNSEAENLDSHNFSYSDESKGIQLKNKDIYKELRLRGYNYKGDFRAIQSCDKHARTALIKWDDNWVTFMDNMLQLKILETDTRLLYVPTFITKLTIMANTHLETINNMILKGEKTPNLTVYNDVITNRIRCGGIEICGIKASAIPRRKLLGIPVLETYKFVPNFTVLDIHQSVRVNIQVILENALTYKVKACEVIDECTGKDIVPLAPIIKSALEDQPLIQPLLKILSKAALEDVEVEVEDKKLKSETDNLLVIGSNLLGRPEVLKEACAVLVGNGFIITRESHQYDTSRSIDPNLCVFTIHRTENETMLLLRKQSKVNKSKYIKVMPERELSWLPEVQSSITKEKNEDIVLYGENKPKNGILGLVNCLRMEPQSRHVRCVFTMDEVEEFDPQMPFYTNQLKKYMAVNVYKDGQWGTYRHLPLQKLDIVEREHCFANVTLRGDLSSLKWIEGPLRNDMKVQPERNLIHVYYCALNFRDVMSALGKISADMINQNRLEQECVQGFEFAGRDSKGNRVMGMIPAGALSSLLLNDIYFRFLIPENWSFEEAATIPVVYGTVIYALIMRGQMTRGESILIHSGTGGVGQAAIRLCLHYGCKVFTTVGTKEKRDFLKKTFPQLKDRNIGNSHDESFEQLVLQGTNGRGVDMVLNSLAGEKLVTSIRCLARGGRFIEIGKFDMTQNHHLNTLLFQKEASFQGVMLDQLFNDPPQIKKELVELMLDGLKYGAIKPLNRTVFKYNELEQAFRYMATGKHTGKVLIQLRKPEKESLVLPTVMKFPGISRYFCNAEKVYIIIGGLGGFGLELTDWLILRGARKVVLSSSRGISTGYQDYRLNIWRSYGVVVKISTAPITTKNGCKQLIEESQKLGPIDAIFNLAVVLADAVFENQTKENFITSFGPKAYSTGYLDELTRQMCPDLSQFVVFSSVSCGRGNAGQTNYGMSNSIMERICEDRKQAGFPALAIQWGAVGEVGLVAEKLENDVEIEISGTLQQKISNCLQVLDIFLRQNESPIVSSIVVAEKRGINSADNVVDAVINILGLNDSKSVSLHSTLPELGMDSMTGVEIKQVLERDFEVFLSPKDIRTMTLAKLREIQNEKLGDDNQSKNVSHFGIEMVIRPITNEVQNSAPYVEMKSKVTPDVDAPTLLLFPGIEGFVNILDGLTENLNAHIVGVQLNLDGDEKTIVEMAQSVLPVNKLALEVVSILEARGYAGTLITIDGAPMLMKEMLLNLEVESPRIFETALVCQLLSLCMSFEEIAKQKEKLFMCPTWEDRMNLGTEIVKDHTIHEANYQKLVANSIYKRAQALLIYTPSYSKLKTNVKLIRPTQCSVTGLPDDYGLSQYFETPIQVQNFEGNHATIIENEAVAKFINTSVGRTEEGVTSLFDSVAAKFDAEYIKLLHDGFSTPPPLYVAFGELDDWYNIGCELMALPTFSAFIQKIQKTYLKQKIADTPNIFSNKFSNKFGEVLGSIVVHLGLIELFRSMEVKPTHLLGYSHGPLLSAYWDGSLSLEETITCAATINETTNNLWLEANNNNKDQASSL